MKKFAVLMTVVFLVGVLSLMAQAEKVLRIPYPEDPKTADCQMTTSNYMLPLNIFDRLVEAVTVRPGESELQPGLAESWEISSDGKVYTFHLRKGSRFIMAKNYPPRMWCIRLIVC